MMDLKKSPISYDIDTQRRVPTGGYSTFACTSTTIRDCCGGPSTAAAKAATLNYKMGGAESMRCATLSRASSLRRFVSIGDRVNSDSSAEDTYHQSEPYAQQCDVVVTRGAGGKILVSGTDIPDKILWKFDDIGGNNPDVVALPDAMVNRTTTL